MIKLLPTLLDTSANQKIMIEFYSLEGTKYIWDAYSENIIKLTPIEIQMTKAKVQLMSDQTILNRVSGNNIKMGIPLRVNKTRMAEVYAEYQRVLKSSPKIMM